mgnify:CR=1 FL=1
MTHYCADFWQLYQRWDACCALSGDDCEDAAELWQTMLDHRRNCANCDRPQAEGARIEQP